MLLISIETPESKHLPEEKHSVNQQIKVMLIEAANARRKRLGQNKEVI
jgi:hypothetical protein